MYQVGIVGCGGIAQVHARVLDQLPDTRLAAFADIVPGRAKKMAAAFGGHAYASMEEMLDAERLDTVHLCTPHALHAPMAWAAAGRGIAVFTEKPPVTSREQWEQLEAAAALAPVGVCFQNRYNPNVQDARRIIAEGEYGPVAGARAFVTWHRDAAYYRDSGWRGAWATEGGSALINQAIHTLDLLVFLLGPCRRVETHMANHTLRGVIETEDTVEAYMELGGAPALLYASNAFAANLPVQIDIQLKSALLRLEADGLEIRSEHGVERRSYQTDEPLGKGYWGNGHLACIRDFYQSLTRNRPYANDVASVRETARLLLDMYAQGKPQLAADRG